MWLGKHIDSNTTVALKQFAKGLGYKSKADIESCEMEIKIGKMLFKEKGEPIDDEKEYPGVGSIAAFRGYIDDPKDVWIMYEVGGKSLTKLLFNIKGEFFKGERIYYVAHMPFYNKLKKDTKLLKQLLKKVIEALDLLQHRKIIHADLKPDNILVEYDGKDITGVKIIDFGSAFFYNKPSGIRMSTPEYLSPECLNCLQKEGCLESTNQELFSHIEPWSIDMWSIGAILLEILTGFPLWLSLKARVEYEGRSIISHGIFAVQGKVTAKIVQKQREVAGNLKEYLDKYDCFTDDTNIIRLLYRLMDVNPKTRISPREVLEDSYLLT